jgi:UMF1 family MFS transporter
MTGKAYPPARARFGWILFDWSTQPFFTLVTTFIFAPYFTSAVVSDPAQGQALWGYATGFAGLCIAMLSPFLGSVADASGPRKPWIALFGTFLFIGCAMLWFAVPGAPYAILLGLLGYVIATLGAEFASVFNNAMMPTLAPPEKLGRLSGTGWAVGYVGGLISLVIALAFLATDPDTGKTLLGRDPAFELDASSRAGDRASGPFAAFWFLIFVLPLFILTPDIAKTGLSLRAAMADGLQSLLHSLRGLRTEKNLARFLFANMIYADGLAALFAFAGIYAAGVFGWGSTQIGIFGILLTVTATLGAWLGGKADDAFGPRPVIALSLFVLILASIGIVGTGRDVIFFVVSVVPADAQAGLFAGPSERVYIALGLLIGLVAGPLQAASRTMLIRLSKPEKIGQNFGLFALSGKVTSFLGPTLVALVTGITASQRAGVAVLIAFFAIGLVLMLRVRQARPE